MRIIISIIFFTHVILISITSTAQTVINDEVKTMSYKINSNTTLEYSRPKLFEFIEVIPRDYGYFPKYVFRKDQIVHIAEIAGVTAVLIAYDQNILDDAKYFGRDIHLAGTSNETTLINQKVFIVNKEIKLQFNIPTDVNSSFYFIGDGWTHITLALAFWAGGLINNDYRSLRTASEIGECIFTTGIATQFIKHITGRESPFTTNVRGGVWRFFPNQSDYTAHTPHYDAFPTGHLATAMATLTVIAQNYPEKKYIRPVGYTLMTLLGFSMLNNGVHWAGDYPFGIALGYVFAKIAVDHGRTVHAIHNSESSVNNWKFSPSLTIISNELETGMGIRWSVVKKYQKVN